MQLELVERAVQGDRDAFASLVASHVDRCYGLAYRILRDPHRAQDATQQALLGAWRDLATLRDPDRFEAWLHRLVVNACYSEARGERLGIPVGTARSRLHDAVRQLRAVLDADDRILATSEERSA